MLLSPAPDRYDKNDTLKALAQHLRTQLPYEQLAQVQAFVDALYRDAALEDLGGRDPDALLRAVLSHWELMMQRPPGQPNIRFYSPVLEQHDWRSSHSIVEIVTDDMPFLVDSVRMALNRHGLSVHLIIHTVVGVERDVEGKLTAFPVERSDAPHEAVIYVEVDRRTEPETFGKLRQDLLEVFADVEAAVRDWGPMKGRIEEILDHLQAHPPAIDPHLLAESKDFLKWIADHHFTFLGYREYRLERQNGENILRLVPGSSLGIARRRPANAVSQTFAALPPPLRNKYRAPELLILTKANVRSTVHRPIYMDYVGIKQFDDRGEIVGEHRFFGLYTSSAYNRNVRDIPLLRRRVRAVFERSRLPRYSHNGKALMNILETYPRDELFQITEKELLDNAMGILHLQERQRVRLFVRREMFGRFVTCIVFVPRERFDSKVRARIQQILLEAFNGENVDFYVQLSQSVLAQLYFTIHTSPENVLDYDHKALEEQVAACSQTWADQFQLTLFERHGEEYGNIMFREFESAFPPAYRDDFSPAAAVRDLDDLLSLSGDHPVVALYRPMDAAPGQFRFKLFSSGSAYALSDILPILENMGVRAIRERPYAIKPINQPCHWIYDFTLSYVEDPDLPIDEVKEIFQQTFADIWTGLVENDGFNRLVLGARACCRDIVILRAYSKYLRQVAIPFSQAYMEQAVSNNADIARQLIALFHARFAGGHHEHANIQSSRIAAELEDALDAVVSLDEDRILRGFMTAILATVRTNYNQPVDDGKPKDYLAFKLDPTMIPELPLPRPKHEIFVYSPQVEGVHLRGGDIARGGLRWSDRREDFRTEILGLMKAQMVKNAIIVPVGAKGGFVVKQPPLSGDRGELMNEVVACYKTFIRGMLDVTDNIVGDRIVPPKNLIRYDNDDSYLVVAADKGTATFSDTANSVAAEYGFWLGDAFASGGSMGYDHKKMGITARGAWESVKRHFREISIDVQTQSFSVVGIGDMSGDVFGNGMLLSRHIKLVAAFDHRHIVIDPNPDIAASFAERERLFNLPRSSWDDYSRDVLSEGGGIYPRTAKAIRLSDAARQVLGTEAESLTPDALIRVILKAPVDLLWNGGIGTYVKATHESDVDVGDRNNDGVRVNGAQLRCRVVGEGGNLGFTQKGRVEYARAGGRINTDFIDNAGGVSCSDYEVNIKILLNTVMLNRGMSLEQRNMLLTRMTNEVAEKVLRENYWQSWVISAMAHQAHALMDQHAAYIRELERSGRLDRELESLPDDEAISQRLAAGQGLTRPELAVLLTYAKNDIASQLLESEAPEDPYLARELMRYFPAELRERYREEIQGHRLRRELIVTFVTNRLVNRMGASFVFGVQSETGAPAEHIVRAYLSIWEIFGMKYVQRDVAALDNKVAAELQVRMFSTETEVVQRGTFWILRNHPGKIDITGIVARYREGVDVLREGFPGLLTTTMTESFQRLESELIEAKVPPALATRVAQIPYLYAALDIVEIAREADAPIARAAASYFAVDAYLELNWLQERIENLPGDNHWQIRARVALATELYAQERRLAAAVLTCGNGSTDIDEALDRWAGHVGHAVAHYREMIAELKKVPGIDLAMLSVVVRELQALDARPAPC